LLPLSVSMSISFSNSIFTTLIGHHTGLATRGRAHSWLAWREPRRLEPYRFRMPSHLQDGLCGLSQIVLSHVMFGRLCICKAACWA
jgi:hypothetical protein